MTEKKHEHVWLTGQVALAFDPDYKPQFILRWVAYPKHDDDADSCHSVIKVYEAEDT